MNPTAQTERQALRERHKKERKEMREKEAIAGIVPLPAQLICVHSNYTAVKYSTSERFPARYSIEKALEILAAWRPYIIPATHVKDSCLSVLPDCARSKPVGEFAKVDGQSCVEISLSGGEGYSGVSYQSHEISFFAKIGDRVLSVDIDFAPRTEWMPRKHIERDKFTGRIISSDFVPASFGEDKRVGWWNPPGSYSFSYYWRDLDSFDQWRAKHAL